MYMKFARVSCLRLLVHLIECALVLARESAGSNMEARIAMIAITTSSSIKVKAERGSVGAWERRSVEACGTSEISASGGSIERLGKRCA